MENLDIFIADEYRTGEKVISDLRDNRIDELNLIPHMSKSDDYTKENLFVKLRKNKRNNHLNKFRKIDLTDSNSELTSNNIDKFEFAQKYLKNINIEVFQSKSNSETQSFRNEMENSLKILQSSKIKCKKLYNYIQTEKFLIELFDQIIVNLSLSENNSNNQKINLYLDLLLLLIRILNCQFQSNQCNPSKTVVDKMLILNDKILELKNPQINIPIFNDQMSIFYNMNLSIENSFIMQDVKTFLEKNINQVSNIGTLTSSKILIDSIYAIMNNSKNMIQNNIDYFEDMIKINLMRINNHKLIYYDGEPEQIENNQITNTSIMTFVLIIDIFDLYQEKSIQDLLNFLIQQDIKDFIIKLSLNMSEFISIRQNNIKNQEIEDLYSNSFINSEISLINTSLYLLSKIIFIDSRLDALKLKNFDSIVNLQNNEIISVLNQLSYQKNEEFNDQSIAIMNQMIAQSNNQQIIDDVLKSDANKSIFYHSKQKQTDVLVRNINQIQKVSECISWNEFCNAFEVSHILLIARNQLNLEDEFSDIENLTNLINLFDLINSNIDWDINDDEDEVKTKEIFEKIDKFNYHIQLNHLEGSEMQFNRQNQVNSNLFYDNDQ